MNKLTQEKTLVQKFFGIFGSKKITEETGSKQEEISNVLNHNPESSIDKKHEQEILIDERITKEKALYTDEIVHIIHDKENLLDSSYHKKLADKVIEIGSIGLFGSHRHRLVSLIEKGDLDKSYYELIFNHSLNGGSRNRSQAEDVLKFMINKKLDRKYFEVFIDQVLKINYRDEYSKLECLIKLVKTACLEGNITFDDYQNTMLRFLDISNPSKNETINIIKMFLDHDREAEVYQGILRKIIVDKKLLTYVYFTDTLAALYKKTNDKMGRDYRCAKIIDTCVDDYLEGTHLEMGKIHIKIALDALKQQEKGNEHRTDYRNYNLTYKKIKEAGIQLLISE